MATIGSSIGRFGRNGTIKRKNKVGGDVSVRSGRENGSGKRDRTTRRVAGYVLPVTLLWLGLLQAPVRGVELEKDPKEWKELLTPEQYHVLIERGTERAGSSPLDKNYEPGTYSCAACQHPLFGSDMKFDSGTGWPSFYDTLPGAVDLTVQPLYLIGDFGAREVRCHRCGSHLGHVFTDGPKPTGKRYCMNGVALNFTPSAST